jgi:asparagine synthase (glutamine-hydrolysing)
MCGINLYIGDNSEVHVRRMNRGLDHRGIRSSVFTKDNFSIGHVRLPIQGIDPEWDHPYTRDGLTVAFVGEIFNYKGLNPSAESDIPVFHELFLKRGSGLPLVVDGFYSAIMHYDQKIYIMLDELGKKPLYMKRDNDSLRVSSEILPLVEEGEPLDEFYFSSVAKWGYHIGEHTPFKWIQKVPPNSFLIIDPKTFSITPGYAALPLFNKAKFLRGHIEEAVWNRLVSDIPISLVLSGGLDSTIIYYLMKKHTTDFKVFHVENNESEYLNDIDFKGIDLKILELDPNPHDAYFFNQTPVDIGSVQPQLALSAAIRTEGYRVAMSGDGADELFGGYKRITAYDSQQSDIFEELVYYHLPRLDRLMMANTVELRCPFLSSDVLRSALLLPYEKRIHKNYLKEVFQDIVPKSIIDRKKVPLRVEEMKKDKVQFRLDVIKYFREVIIDEYYRCAREEFRRTPRDFCKANRADVEVP